PTIITPQGFHLDIPDGMTHPFWEYAELRAIFEKIARERQQRVDAASHLTWTDHARQHLTVWQALLDGRRAEIPSLLNHPDRADARRPTMAGSTMAERFQEYARLANGYRWSMVKQYYKQKLKRWVSQKS